MMNSVFVLHIIIHITNGTAGIRSKEYLSQIVFSIFSAYFHQSHENIGAIQSISQKYNIGTHKDSKYLCLNQKSIAKNHATQLNKTKCLIFALCKNFFKMIPCF